MNTDSIKEEIEMETNKVGPGVMAQWRLNGIGLLRILFGIVWALTPGSNGSLTHR
jgi:hypothetical protein